MPWKVKKPLLDYRGEPYAMPGDFLADDDAVALAAKPNQIVRVQPEACAEVAPQVIVEPEPEPWPDEPEEEEEDEGIDL